MSDDSKSQDVTETEVTDAAAEGAAPADDASPSAPSPLEAAEARVKELEAKLAAAEADAKNHHARTLRVAADFENHRKRSAREVDEARRTGAQSALGKLLPVFDNLERATSHMDATSDAKSMADGLRMVMKQFGEALGKLGIERVEAVGRPFDPTVHESIQYEHHDTIAAGLVSKELQAGYRQGDSLLRPALVVVSKGPEPASSETAPEEPAKGDDTSATSEDTTTG